MWVHSYSCFSCGGRGQAASSRRCHGVVAALLQSLLVVFGEHVSRKSQTTPTPVSEASVSKTSSASSLVCPNTTVSASACLVFKLSFGEKLFSIPYIRDAESDRQGAVVQLTVVAARSDVTIWFGDDVERRSEVIYVQRQLVVGIRVKCNLQGVPQHIYIRIELQT
ncbi:hypothetical protein AAG570_007972 [Ranatra chinensis]|uniref:Uncharacterized protein n=1 Tax=Ranatra chinensis TaxID=642074 RepID=A0ABD0XTE2_9HEMI